MAHKFIYLSNEFSSSAAYTLGDTAQEFLELEKSGIHTPKSVVIPINTLKIIAEQNNLQAKCYKLIQNTTFSSSLSLAKTARQLKGLIENQSVPKELGSLLLKTYHRYFSDEFVKIQTSNRVQNKTYAIENIHSDTNMVASILELWAEILAAQISRLQTKQHSLHEILFATPIIIIKQLEPTVSGKAITFDTTTGTKQRITINSSWGVYTDESPFDTYYADVRTENITQKNIPHKEWQYRRVLGKLRKDQVLKQKQDQSTLSQKDVRNLVSVVSKIKKKYLSQLEIRWAYVTDQLYIESIEPVELTYTHSFKESQKTLTKKLFVTVPLHQSTQIISDQVDGLAVLNSGQLLSVTGVHPQEVAKSKQKELLISAISKKIQRFVSRKNLPLLYRANNYTSYELNKLKAGAVFETTEKNPSLGYRGGIRYLSQTNAFDIELAIVQSILSSTKKPVGLLLPFVRSASELQQLISKIKNEGLLEHSHFSVWLELSTPANLLELSEYPLEKLGGVVCNTNSIQALSYGVDPQSPEIYSRYSYSSELLTKLLETAIQTIQEKTQTLSNFKKPSIFVDLTDFNKQILEAVYDLEITGFIVNESVTELTKKCMIKKEQRTVV